ncbi:hypothetical protein [Paraburkholderia sp. MM6662-R1]|uniref:hypothetical protein n=1 Tax=Paraburkholderia sp. MM6662-R1 TaxID=2991066 RepID=UPI003D1F9550
MAEDLKNGGTGHAVAMLDNRGYLLLCVCRASRGCRKFGAPFSKSRAAMQQAADDAAAAL